MQKQKSARTRRAYRLDVQHFIATLGISMVDELRQADHKAVITWERYMREVEHAASSAIRRRLAALSSLFRHLIDYGGAVDVFPVSAIPGSQGEIIVVSIECLGEGIGILIRHIKARPD